MDRYLVMILLLISCLLIFTMCLAGLFVAQSASIQRQCKQDCTDVNGEYKRTFTGSRSENQCICELKGETKNIW